MKEFTYFSPRASLAAVGPYMQEKNIWDTVENTVQIQQNGMCQARWTTRDEKLLSNTCD